MTDTTEKSSEMLPIAERDLELVKKEDFRNYALDLENNGSFITYYEQVAEGSSFHEDINFAIFDLAWRMRLDDALEKDEVTTKAEAMLAGKEKRAGFVLAYNLLNYCCALEEGDEKIFVGALQEKRLKLSERLQDFAVSKTGEYLAGIDTITTESEPLLLDDIKAISMTIDRSVGMGYWQTPIDMKRRVGEGYLDMEHLAKLVKSVDQFRAKKMTEKYAAVEASLDLILGRKKQLEELGIDFEKI